MKKFRFFVILIFTVGIVVFIGLSPFFDITRFNITGTHNLTDNQIVSLIAEENDNIFLFRSSSAVTTLENNPYIYSVTISKAVWARHVNIDVVERVQIGYVRFDEGRYLRIDRHGYVMSSTSEVDVQRPIIIGLDMIPFTLGEPLEMSEMTLYIIAQFADIFVAYDVEPDFVLVNPTDLHNIKLMYHNIVVNFGSPTDLAEKFRIFLSLAEMPEINFHRHIGGQLNITNIDRNWTFNMLT